MGEVSQNWVFGCSIPPETRLPAGAAQIVLGAARMVLRTGKQPADLGKLSAGLRETNTEEGLKFYTEAYEEAATKLKELAAVKV